MTGVIKTWRAALGSNRKFFFIAGDDGQDYFAHQDDLIAASYDELRAGMRCSFQVVSALKGPRAANIVVHTD